jgi:hypothetical protein
MLPVCQQVHCHLASRAKAPEQRWRPARSENEVDGEGLHVGEQSVTLTVCQQVQCHLSSTAERQMGTTSTCGPTRASNKWMVCGQDVLQQH